VALLNETSTQKMLRVYHGRMLIGDNSGVPLLHFHTHKAVGDLE